MARRYCPELLGTMAASPQFPDDENGHLLRRMHDEGDDLAQPRVVEFGFVFPQRSQALSFAEKVPDKLVEVCISHLNGRDMWQVAVKHFMVPTHQQITEIENELNRHAKPVGGELDGWSCLPINAVD
jgi:hypothetical protein